MYDTQNEKKIKELLPIVQVMARKFVADCKKAGFELFVDCTYRSPEEQNKLYNRPFDKIDNDGDNKIDEADEKVTNAKAYESFHQYRVAMDVYPVVGGEIIFNSPFTKTAPIGKACGFEWGGDWTSFPDKPHFQYTAGFTLEDFKKTTKMKEKGVL